VARWFKGKGRFLVAIAFGAVPGAMLLRPFVDPERQPGFAGPSMAPGA
jgi:hypothetical protein